MITVIPAIDLIEGRCVRLSKGDFSKKTVYGDPLTIAKTFAESGARYLHLVDLDGAKAGSPQQIHLLESIVKETRLKVDFSGGIRTDSDIKAVFSAGASQITLGSIALKNPELFYQWLDEYGAEKIILASDFRDGLIALSGWTEASEVSLHDFLTTFVKRGGIYTLCTDISRDGMLSGPALNTYQEIQKTFPTLKIIASGGISSRSDITALNQLGLYGVVVGKAFFEGKIPLSCFN
ncbi:MAG: 1-(5-phosphoribosyl)-5-[(5-phosphoribosylamino)methylideneamino]imidazole-4-carboxamide isomerase [Bdellovibrionota bacterium]|jgi:phosphoribosylformimino-5-aminoimidazole carboxamide ribotide isomerase